MPPMWQHDPASRCWRSRDARVPHLPATPKGDPRRWDCTRGDGATMEPGGYTGHSWSHAPRTCRRPAARGAAGSCRVSVVTLRGVRREIGATVILDEVALSVAAGERIGLVGPNGAGKTTLLKIVAGIERPDHGEVHHARGLRIRLLAQESAHDPELLRAASLTEAVIGGAAETVSLAAALREMELAGRADSVEYAEARGRFDALDGYALEERVGAALRGLGFPTARHAEPPSRLSGGEQTRVALARLVIADPDVLLLDEPTNHLDVEAIEWLEGALRARSGALIVASHDRAFLDAVIDRVWEVRSHHVTRFRGNYSAYARQRLAVDEGAERDADRREKAIARERELIQTYRSHRKYAKMHEHERRLAAIEPVLREARGASLSIAAEGAGRGPAEPLRVSETLIGYREPSRVEIARIRRLVLHRGDRIGIVGPNGAGKSTLLKTIAGLLPPLAGGVEMATGVVPGYLAQIRAAGLHGATVLDALRSAVPVEPGEARAHLAKFLFRGDAVGREVAVLSGGERSRLELAILGLMPTNLLLLDEPTNHLDIDACESLERFLLEGERTLLVVSHDRRMLERVCTSLWVVDGGVVVPFDGGYAAWREAVAAGWNSAASDAIHATQLGAPLARLGTPVDHAPPTSLITQRSKTVGDSPKPKRLSKEQLRRRRAAIEADLERHGLRKGQLELALLDPLIVSSYTEVAKVTSELADVTAALQQAEEEWLRLEGEAVK
ncbi:MAG: ABC transporter ATP-binding protein [bacterium]|nr:ABC transporter ATP-binding protein [Candidatus Aquidulcis sp.]